MAAGPFAVKRFPETFHAEQGKVHAYTKQGVLTTPYEILAADKEAKTLTLQANFGNNPAACVIIHDD